MTMLRINDLCVNYGMREAVKNVSMELTEGKVISLLGANGSGKSTILKTISGLKDSRQGEIFFGDTKINGMEIDKIVSIFLDLTIIGDPKQPQLQIDIARIIAGKLPIPVDALVKHLGKHNSSVAIDEFLQLLDVINGNKFDPIASVPGNRGHLIRLLDLDLTSDMLELKVSIEQLE